MTSEQLEVLKNLAMEKNYGRGARHAKQVNKLSLKIYDELVRLHMLKETNEDRQILETAALLHDIGVGQEPHNKIAFDKLISEIPKRMNAQPLSKNESSVILYCVLYHRGHEFSEREGMSLTEPVRTKHLAAILRIADGLDYGPPFDKPIKDVNLKTLGDAIVCQVVPCSKDVKNRVERYCDHTKRDKVDLFKEAYGVKEVSFEITEG